MAAVADLQMARSNPLKQSLFTYTKRSTTMKKIIYIILFALVSAASITACTEEEVTPQQNFNGGGRGSADDAF
jgi:hypothetical protein